MESASNIPKTKFGKPDPIVSVIFKGKKKFSSFSEVLFWNVSFLGHLLEKSAFRRLMKPVSPAAFVTCAGQGTGPISGESISFSPGLKTHGMT